MSTILAPLRLAPFRRLAPGGAAAMLGNGGAPIALAFAVLRTTGSLTQLGLVVAVRSLFSGSARPWWAWLAARRSCC